MTGSGGVALVGFAEKGWGRAGLNNPEDTPKTCCLVVEHYWLS